MINLYPDQNNLVTKIRNSIIKGHKSLAIQSPTGSGKTVIFSYIAKNAIEKGGKILILTDRIELLTETGGTLSNFGINHFQIKAGQMVPPPDYFSCYVAMSQTLRRRISDVRWNKWFKQFTIVVVDELHKQEFNPFFETENLFNGAQILGFSATPSRTGKQRQLGSDYSYMVEGLQVQELIDLNRLLPAKHFGVSNIQKTKFKLNSHGDDYDENEMFQAFNRPEVYAGAIKAYNEHAPGTVNLVFCCNIAHVIETCKEFNAAGIKAKFLVSDVAKPKYPENPTPGNLSRYEKHLEQYNNWKEAFALYSGSRDQILQDWKSGAFKVLINAGILTTGFNAPFIQTIQVLRATISIPLWLQIVGRGSRLFSGKSHFNILDHGTNIQRLGRYNENRKWSLIHEESKGGGAPPIKECGKGEKLDKAGRKGCGAYIATSVMLCPYCGYQYVTDKEKMEAQLILLNEPILSTAAPVKKIYEFEEIERTAAARGYKEGWTVRQIALKHGFEGLKQFGKSKGRSNGWAFMQAKMLKI